MADDELLQTIDKNEQIELWNQLQRERHRPKSLASQLEESLAEMERLKNDGGNKKVIELQDEIKRLRWQDPDCKRLAALKRQQSKLRKRLREEEESKAREECPICMDRPQDVCVNPDGCKHQFCSKCALRMQHCPMCRAEITTRVPL